MQLSAPLVYWDQWGGGGGGFGKGGRGGRCIGGNGWKSSHARRVVICKSRETRDKGKNRSTQHLCLGLKWLLELH